MYHKKGIIIKELCEELLSKSKGDRIKSITEYAVDFNVARGTIQNAFTFLKENKAIKTISRGHLGTYIASIDINRLIEISGHRDIIGVMPLPYSELYQGFATALYLDAQSKHIDLQMAFMRGAKSRLKMLLNGNYDFVTMSLLSATYYLDQYPQLEISLRFGKYTYLKEHSMVFANKNVAKVKDGMRIGIDYNSKDVVLLTQHQCQGREVEYVSLPYIQLLNKLKSKEIDMAIMNADDLITRGENLNFVAIDNNHFKWSDTEAVIVTDRNNKFSKIVFQKFLSKKNILKIQNDVLSGKRDPVY